MEACRACLTTEDGLVPLDESSVAAYNLITNLNVALFDSMPQYACNGCLVALKFCIDFRERCITTETSLQLVLQQKVEPEENKCPEVPNIKVKEEVKDEKSYETIFDDCFDDNFSSFIDDFDVKKEPDDVKPKKRKYRKKKKLPLVENAEELNTKSCGLCTKTFTEQEQLSKHVDSHKSERKCGLCPEILNTWPEMVGHRMNHLPKKGRRCHVCNIAVFSANHLQYHYLSKHCEGENTQISCRFCGRIYATRRKLAKHINGIHSTKCLICDFCSKTFNNKQRLISHIKSHTDVKTFVCDICDFSCKFKNGLKDHKLRKHTPSKVKCESCLRVFASLEDKGKHKCSVVTKICPICGIQVNHRLNKHLLKHSTAMPYKCERCPAQYKSRAALTAHLNRHTDTRPKQCEYCPLRFFTTSVLIKHRRIHTGEKPYVCKICHKGFTGNYNLKVHMKVHGEHLVTKRLKPETQNAVPNFYTLHLPLPEAQ